MKTYQFVGFMVLGLVVAAALMVSGKRKKCGCGGHASVTVPVTEDATT